MSTDTDTEAAATSQQTLRVFSTLSAALAAGYGVLFTMGGDYRDEYGISETTFGLIIGIGFLLSFFAQVTIGPYRRPRLRPFHGLRRLAPQCRWLIDDGLRHNSNGHHRRSGDFRIGDRRRRASDQAVRGCWVRRQPGTKSRTALFGRRVWICARAGDLGHPCGPVRYRVRRSS